MDRDNQTTVSEFILLGLTDHPQLQVLLFVLFFVIYVTTLLGNFGMITVIKVNPQLHTPMYFFLSNLFVLDLFYSSVSAPRLLVDFLMESKTISYSACITQFYFFALLVTTEALLLAVMAYDRYVAICNPLLYTVTMPRRICIQLVAGSYIGGLTNSLVHTCGLLGLPFCGPNVIKHFFCDLPPLLELACSDTHNNETLLLIFSGIIAAFSLSMIFISYLYVLSAILRTHSAEGRCKAFSTCTSHLTAVTVFYGSVTFSYIQPSSSYSLEQEKVSSVFYSLVVPMLKPIIYSLRNKEVKDTLRRLIARKNFLR
ncbi:olfactory receptor 1052-like isoform X1 [Alligator mississippiensis]|uniref:olfactory receptor 1052-like isoform X1 n=1 Tax=Alligator mississippiensis TaxID=8496 RepID=UPI0003D0C005|nr:olfactory receptor 1052-like isoform X1 [Alligator mississippiensis]